MTLESELEGLSVPAPGSVSSGVALGTGLSDGFRVFESPLGSVVVAFNPLGVSRLTCFTDGSRNVSWNVSEDSSWRLGLLGTGRT